MDILRILPHAHEYRPVDVRYYDDRAERIFRCKRCGKEVCMTYEYAQEGIKKEGP